MKDFFDELDNAVHDVEAVSQIPVDPTWRPDSGFVICRDASGTPTAVYGRAYWDLNPIRLRAASISKIRFDKIFEFEDDAALSLIEEVRYILFCLFFYVDAGRLGRLSATVLYGYYRMLRYAANFCYSQRANPLVGTLSLKMLFSNPAYLSAYSKWMGDNNIHNDARRNTRALIVHLTAVGEERLGFKLQNVFGESFGAERQVSNQTPVVPTRIYIGMINDLAGALDFLYLYKDRLEGFLSCFQDPRYGCTADYQIERFGVSVGALSPTLEEAIRIHRLEEFFVGEYQLIGIGSLDTPHRSGVSAVVMKIHWVLKNVIHLFTGMRDQEVMRLPYSCMDEESVTSPLVNDEGVTRDDSMIVKIISTTTKFTGYRKSVAWLATVDVERAVDVLQAICRGLSRVYNVDCDKMPLFLSPVVILKREAEPKVSNYDSKHRPDFFGKYVLLESDVQELLSTDPSRNYSEGNEFKVGASWHFTTHQFRRSLAFYGSSSGFISLPSLRKQFKHLATQMTRYYANNFEKLKTIFGYYDSGKGKFVVPKNHFLFEYQTGVPMNIAYDLLDHAFGDNSALFGGVGSYISNQREKMSVGDIHVSDLRKETEKLAMEGKISYRMTLLGGCTKTGKCDAYLLGNAVSCFSCPEGIIEKEKLEDAIADDEAQLALYTPGTGEYQVVEAELKSFKKYYQRFIPAVEVG